MHKGHIHRLLSNKYYTAVSSLIIFFLLFLLQFVYFPIGVSPFEASKVYITELCVFLLTLIRIFSGDFLSFRKNIFFVFIGGFIILLSLYHLLFHLYTNTFWGNPFRMQGTLFLWFCLLFTWISMSIRLKRISFVFLFGVLFFQLILSFWVNSGTLFRAVGSMGEPNSLAGIFVFLWPFLFITEFFVKRNILWRVILILFVWIIVGMAIFISGSRSAFVAFLLQISFCSLLGIFRLPFKWSVVLCFFFLFLSYFLPFLEQSGLYENRGEVWQSALFAGFRHPFFGVGFGNIEYAIHMQNVRLGNHLQGYYVDSSHNIFLDWFLEGGILGEVLFLLLLGKALVSFVIQKDFFFLLLLFGLLGVLSFNPVSVSLLISFWWVLGQGIL